MLEDNPAKHKKKSQFREYVEALGVAILAALILRAVVIQAFRIPTGSMKDTLLIGDFLLVNKFIYGAKTPERIPYLDVKLPSFRFPALTHPKRGDIIVFKYPQDEKLDYIKRCIAVGGDTLEIREGLVYINNKPYENSKFREKKYDQEEYKYINYYDVETIDGKRYTIRHYADGSYRYYNFGPRVIPKDALFMMGDNRDNSQDSRYWGMMPLKNVVGQALVIYFSWEKGPIFKFYDQIRWGRIFSVIR